MKTRDKINIINSQIKDLEKQRDGLRKQCNHKNVKVVKWSWRIGVVDDAEVCADCDEFLYYVNDKCKCKNGATGRRVTADFKYQICDTCGKTAR